MAVSDPSWEHYRTERGPRSSGRVLLSHALETHTLLNWGLSGRDIADAFAPGGSRADRKKVHVGIGLFEAPLVEGRFRTWARLFGGGPAELLEPAHWEIDDFAPRFARSALCLARPFDHAADPTHWIFVEEVVIEALHDLHREVPRSRARPARPAARDDGDDVHEDADDATASIEDEALLRMPDVERLAGLRKSTIYARIAQGRFPAQVRNGDRVSSWREAEVRAWLRDPR